jgi:hypothetical protein
MTFYCFPFLKVQPAGYGAVIRVSFFDVSMTGSKMCRYETKTCVMIIQAYSDGPFVSRNASQSSLKRNMMSRSILISHRHTFLEVPSTFLIIAVSSDLTRIIRAVPTSYETLKRQRKPQGVSITCSLLRRT